MEVHAREACRDLAAWDGRDMETRQAPR